MPPRLRLERNPGPRGSGPSAGRVLQEGRERDERQESQGQRASRGSQSSQRGSGSDDAGVAQPGTDLATLTVPGDQGAGPRVDRPTRADHARRGLRPGHHRAGRDILGRAADERLAGTSTGETLIRVGQLLLGATGFVLVALGLASILGQVIS